MRIHPRPIHAPKGQCWITLSLNFLRLLWLSRKRCTLLIQGRYRTFGCRIWDGRWHSKTPRRERWHVISNRAQRLKTEPCNVDHESLFQLSSALSVSWVSWWGGVALLRRS
ncbi:hypothetical protein BS50DRAFT_38064 [Corynespora cassiicola Philippines]|uniref:Uncharacterized protein n=1 Tax=Corynespora cassiicola Philippines TaxID=1448308 RepID=A0A2T2PCF4_CORCC|nr:hypothetical protein BS50DRAFT_38064 [Corynespora cassiicola Philippines]